MEEIFNLVAKKRENTKKSARDVRDIGSVPGVVYGKGVEPFSVSVDASDILRTYRRAGQTSLIDLDVEGKKIKVLIHEAVLHPVKNTIYHVDFFVVNLKEKTHVLVPFAITGESPAVKNLGGILTTDHDAVNVKCLPSNIPHEISIDISVLNNVHDSIAMKDVELPKGVELLHPEDKDMVICSVVAPRMQVESNENQEENSEESGE